MPTAVDILGRAEHKLLARQNLLDPKYHSHACKAGGILPARSLGEARGRLVRHGMGRLLAADLVAAVVPASALFRIRYGIIPAPARLAHTALEPRVGDSAPSRE
jgi:hypothetical protein